MATAPSLTLIHILDHKDTFLSFIDMMDARQEGALEGDTYIPIATYNQKIAALVRQASLVEGQRLQDALSLDNLERNNFLLDYNKQQGVVAFLPFIVDMLRHLDALRLKELSDKHLNDLRLRLANVVRSFTGTNPATNENDPHVAPVPMVKGHPDFVENVVLMNQVLNEVNDALQKNVLSLEAQSQHLSHILDSESMLSLSGSEHRREALSRVHTLQERHIKPMLQFINADQDYKDGLNPIKMIIRLENCMTTCRFPDHAERLVNARIRILSHAKPAQTIAKVLNRYIRQDQEERLRYNAIEDQFNRLLSASRNVLQNGNLKSRYLPSGDASLALADRYYGLKTHSQASRSRMDWYEEGQYERFLSERVRAYRESTAKRVTTSLSKTPSTVRPVDTARMERAQQIRRIQQAMSNFLYTGEPVDAYRLLHQYMQDALNDYWLGDLVEVMGILKHHHAYRFTYSPGISELSHNGYRLRYLNTLLEARR